MGHWYLPDGTPVHFTDKKGGGTRNTTLADARKAGNYIPGVTSILDILDKPALTRWKVMQAVQAVVTAPDVAGEGLDAKIVRVLEIEGQQDEESRRAKDRGTEIHTAIENVLSGRTTIELIDDACVSLGMEKLSPWIGEALKEVAARGSVVSTESVVVGNGYAGRVDLVLESEGVKTVVDFKTCKTLPKAPWFEHRLQLAAYAIPLSIDRTANLYISTTEPGLCQWFENERVIVDYDSFACLVKVWQRMNNYVPQQ